VIEHLVIMADATFLDLSFVAEQLETRRSSILGKVPETLEELKAVKKEILDVQFGQAERVFLIKAMTAARGNISLAAKRTGMQRSNLSALMKKHTLRSVDYKD
jgi:transcriptional regulator of acetoin/glycerol metabolism